MLASVTYTFDPASILAATVALVGLIWGIRTHREVKTINGKTIAKITDEGEGRRIRDTIPVEEQTSSDRKYVEDLEKSDPHLGHKT